VTSAHDPGPTTARAQHLYTVHSDKVMINHEPDAHRAGRAARRRKTRAISLSRMIDMTHGMAQHLPDTSADRDRDRGGMPGAGIDGWCCVHSHTVRSHRM